MNTPLTTIYSQPISMKYIAKILGRRHFLRFVLRREFFRAKIAAIYYLRPRPVQKNCFILCSQRTGSNLLVSYLNCLPAVSFGSEILANNLPNSLRAVGISKKAALRHLRHFLNYLGRPLCGAKLMFPHLQMRNISLRELHKEFPQAQWIVIYRRNIFDQYLSYKMAWQASQWRLLRQCDRPKLEKIRIQLDCNDALTHRDWLLQSYKEILETPEIHERALWLSYEELSADPQKVFAEVVCPYLGVPASAVSTKLIKQNIWRYPEIISNYEEVKDFIERTDFTQNYTRYYQHN